MALARQARMPHQPLSDFSVLLTRPAQQAQRWADALHAAGARPILYPTIAIQPPPSWDQLDEALTALSSYDWIVFTSATAVRNTAARMKDPQQLSASARRVAAVGDETQRALEQLGVAVSVVPADQHGVGLAGALADLTPGTRILFPQAMGGRPDLREALTEQGCTVDVVPVSHTVAVTPLPPLPDFDAVVFASPSALRAFVAGHSIAILDEKLVVVLGPSTSGTAQALGITAHVTSTPSIQAVIDLLANLRQPRKKR